MFPTHIFRHVYKRYEEDTEARLVNDSRRKNTCVEKNKQKNEIT